VRVIIVSSEAVPFSKSGGLGDVAGALPGALRRAGDVDAALITPLYETTKHELLKERVFDDLAVEWQTGERVSVFYSESAAGGAPAFLIDAPRYFARPGLYGYRDDHERFAFFSRAALALVKRLGGRPPDIVHLNDWFGGFAAVELQARRRYDEFYSRTRTLLSIHNLAFQGTFDPVQLSTLGFGGAEEQEAFRTDGSASALKAGLVASDALSTVSRRYAIEIQTPEQGYKLDWILRVRSDRLAGITNGIDYEVWNPAIDPHLAAHFDADDLTGKQMCKADLLASFNLPIELERPIIAIVTRLTAQKGVDLIREAAGAILDSGAFFIALGSGADEYEKFLQEMREHAPDRVGVYLGFNESLAHRIEAGADIFLMPSLYEPCGLNQMYSMRYGTVPVVRATGGLDDTVEEFDRTRKTGNGFKFAPYAASALLENLYEALYCYADKEVWRIIQRNGMRTDNSWDKAASRYAELYRAVSLM
jgi:starch synthase